MCGKEPKLGLSLGCTPSKVKASRLQAYYESSDKKQNDSCSVAMSVIWKIRKEILSDMNREILIGRVAYYTIGVLISIKRFCEMCDPVRSIIQKTVD